MSIIAIMAARSPSDDASQIIGLAQWREVFCSQMFGLDISSSDPGFTAQLAQRRLGPVSATRLVAGPQEVIRGEGLIARDRSQSALDLVAVRAGVMEYEQAGRRGQVRPGEAVLLDRRQPYRFAASASRSVAISLNHDWLTRWVPQPRTLAGLHIDGGTGWGRALAAVTDQLGRGEMVSCSVPDGLIADQIAGLIALAAGDCGVTDEARGERRFVRLLQLLHDNAHDPLLNADSAAALLGLSRRTLFLVCAQAGASFGQLLLRIRLERARDMLADQRTLGLPVQEIAYRCGFADPGHFSRRFAQSFGAPPACWRQTLHN
jgi:AraC-like DNA-binding protein